MNNHLKNKLSVYPEVQFCLNLHEDGNAGISLVANLQKTILSLQEVPELQRINGFLHGPIGILHRVIEPLLRIR